MSSGGHSQPEVTVGDDQLPGSHAWLLAGSEDPFPSSSLFLTTEASPRLPHDVDTGFPQSK